MGVGVDEAREDPATRSVSNLIAIAGLDGGRDADDLVTLQSHITHA